MSSTRSELLFFRCPACAHCARWSRRLLRAPAAGRPAPYVCGRCGHHAVPGNLRLIAMASLAFFGVAAVCLSLLSGVIPLGHDTAFFLDIVLSVAFFHWFARRVITWRSVPERRAGERPTSA